MCGRFVRTSGKREIADEFGLELDDIVFLLEPGYNIAPGNDVAAVVRKDRAAVEALRWGLVPSWAKNEGTGYMMVNARAETLSEKPSFKKALEKRRCLIIADGFYEWSGEGKQKKPYYFHLKNHAPMGLAGLYESWHGPDDRIVNSCAIITIAANSLMQPIHGRMPAIISRDNYRRWLDNSNLTEGPLTAMLEPYSSDEMEYYPVGPLVNSPRNNSAQCLESVR